MGHATAVAMTPRCRGYKAAARNEDQARGRSDRQDQRQQQKRAVPNAFMRIVSSSSGNVTCWNEGATHKNTLT